MKVFRTSFFWIVVVVLALFYLKTFDDTMGAKVAAWISTTPVVMTGEVASGTQDILLSGMTTMQASLDAMNQKMDDIANKLGITAVVVTTGTVALPEVATGKATTSTTK